MDTDIAAAVASIVGGCTLLGFVIKGTNSLTEIKVMMASLIKDNDEAKAHRKTTDATLGDHDHRIRSLESDVSELQDGRE